MSAQIQTWEEMNDALDKLMASGATPFEALVAFRELRRHAADIPAGREGEDVKRMVVDAMGWAIDFIVAEVGQ
jgi:mannose-6-phosphate isomerase class I